MIITSSSSLPPWGTSAPLWHHFPPRANQFNGARAGTRALSFPHQWIGGLAQFLYVSVAILCSSLAYTSFNSFHVPSWCVVLLSFSISRSSVSPSSYPHLLLLRSYSFLSRFGHCAIENSKNIYEYFGDFGRTAGSVRSPR